MEGEGVEALQIGKEMPMTDPTFFCVAMSTLMTSIGALRGS